MMIRRLALVSGLAVLSAVAFASQAGAQAVPQDVQFGGNITGNCTFSGTTNGTLAATPNNNSVEATTGTTIGTTGNTAQTTLNCTSGGTLSVGTPVRVAAPAAFVDTVRQAIVYDPNNLTFTSSSGPAFSPVWAKTTTPLTIPANTNRILRVGMIAGTPGSGTLPTGTYTYRVTLTATPN